LTFDVETSKRHRPATHIPCRRRQSKPASPNPSGVANPSQLRQIQAASLIQASIAKSKPASLIQASITKSKPASLIQASIAKSKLRGKSNPA
jgi:hypothetical protein